MKLASFENADTLSIRWLERGERAHRRGISEPTNMTNGGKFDRWTHMARIPVFIRDGDSSLRYKKKKQTTDDETIRTRCPRHICMFCVSLIISPASYNGHHVAGCFAVDWMKLIKLKGRGELPSGWRWREKGKGKCTLGLRTKGWYLFNVACVLRMRSGAYHRPYATRNEN